MLEKITYGILLSHPKSRLTFLVPLCLLIVSCSVAESCSPGRSGTRRRSTRKLTPLVFKQHVPNVPENSFSASGPPEGRIRRDDVRFRNLVPNYNTDIVFKDEEGTGVDRLMTTRCKEKLDILAISVMNMWPGVRLRVTEGFDEDGHHPKNSLHYEGRAVAISTNDRDISKYGMLARLAVDAGFDWVFYESRTHIYCSVKTESTIPSRFSGCFHGTSQIITLNGKKSLKDVQVGEEVLSTTYYSQVPIFTKVIGFLHNHPHHVADFVEIQTSLNGTLLVTGDHLILKEQTAVHAKDIHKGDFVIAISRNGSVSKTLVTSIEHGRKTGVYAPLTESGTIVVNGIVCSCYAVIEYHDVAHFAFLPLRLIYKIKDALPEVIHDAYKLIFNWIDPSNSTKLSYPHQGSRMTDIHWYAKLLCELSGIFVMICR